MDLPSITRISLKALARNKMRLCLTMLGVIIGVGAVIAMLAVGKGASRRISEQIASIGSNLLIVLPGVTTAGGVRMGSGSQPTLTVGDAGSIKEQCPSVLDVAPELSGVSQVIYGNRNWPSGVRGTTPNFLEVRQWAVSSGRMFTAQETRAAAKVAVLGQTVSVNLFGDMDPVGETVRIGNMPFRVVGVLEAKGQTDYGRDQDEIVLVPLSTAQKKLFRAPLPGMVRVITVKARGFNALYSAQREITVLLRQRHRIGPRQEDDFTVRNITERLQAYEESSKTMATLLGSIAFVSLLVGGIGIMNIMLVSVTERTREIGIRMAVGAKTWDIRMQFLVEALALSSTGGVVGIAAGVASSRVLSMTMGWDTVVSPVLVLVAFSFSGVVGLFFGFYPAYKASLLKPIDALRYE